MYHVYTDANLTYSISFQNVLYKYDVPNMDGCKCMSC